MRQRLFSLWEEP